MKETIKEQIDIKTLLAKYELKTIIYDSEAYKEFKSFDDETLKIWLSNLEDVIKLNLEQKIYSKNVKDNLYKILSIYRERFKESYILNKVNELITILNKSDETNVYGMLKKEFDIRYMSIAKRSLVRMSKLFDINDIEGFVIDSICSDYNFLKSLVDDNDAIFFDLTSCDFIYLTSLSYLLNHYAYILKDKKIIDKILRLLKCNMEISKDLKQRGLEQDGDLEDVYYESKACLKKIKKLKIDRL